MTKQKQPRRLHTISSKVSADQYELVARRAEHDRVSISEYVRLRSLAGVEAQLTIDYLQALMAEVCSLRTIIAYTVANLTTGRKLDAVFMKGLFADADAMKYQEADLRLAQARIRRPQES